jgi:hypothetical protein
MASAPSLRKRGAPHTSTIFDLDDGGEVYSRDFPSPVFCKPGPRRRTACARGKSSPANMRRSSKPDWVRPDLTPRVRRPSVGSCGARQFRFVGVWSLRREFSRSAGYTRSGITPFSPTAVLHPIERPWSSDVSGSPKIEQDAAATAMLGSRQRMKARSRSPAHILSGSQTCVGLRFAQRYWGFVITSPCSMTRTAQFPGNRCGGVWLAS